MSGLVAFYWVGFSPPLLLGKTKSDLEPAASAAWLRVFQAPKTDSWWGIKGVVGRENIFFGGFPGSTGGQKNPLECKRAVRKGGNPTSVLQKALIFHDRD